MIINIVAIECFLIDSDRRMKKDYVEVVGNGVLGGLVSSRFLVTSSG